MVHNKTLYETKALTHDHYAQLELTSFATMLCLLVCMCYMYVASYLIMIGQVNNFLSDSHNGFIILLIHRLLTVCLCVCVYIVRSSDGAQTRPDRPRDQDTMGPGHRGT